jgi:hypothetical protein
MGDSSLLSSISSTLCIKRVEIRKYDNIFIVFILWEIMKFCSNELDMNDLLLTEEPVVIIVLVSRSTN